MLELAAGTGRISLPLARAGVMVTALDISRPLLDALLEKAGEERLRIDVVKADIRSFSPNRKFRLIILPFNSIE